ncbi:uncharacterized protein [Triticum aestivum]|uniref:uncharacterized protein n=1 Tax=Triticum aestivum TaxID=4565 RepID=UPI001D019CCB|nr:uncharacterized protein LOC123114787 [Triticum aestivum]
MVGVAKEARKIREWLRNNVNERYLFNSYSRRYEICLCDDIRVATFDLLKYILLNSTGNKEPFVLMDFAIKRNKSKRQTTMAGTSDKYLSQCPATTEDMDWCGTVCTGNILCIHKLSAKRMVAFEGQNTGRRFFGCAEREGNNCGVVDWVDPKWPDTLKRALKKLWYLYEQNKIDNLAKVEELSKLAEEKKQLEEKYHLNIKLTKDFCESIEKQVHRENDLKIMKESGEEKIAQEERAKLEKENMELKKQVDLLKHIQAAQAEVIRNWKKDADEGIDEGKQEKKKLEYAIVDLLKAGR